MGGLFVYFPPSPVGWFYQGSILPCAPLCVSTSTDALSSERKGLLSLQLAESEKEVVSPLRAVLEAGLALCVSHKAFALPLGAKLTAGGTATVVT